MGSGHSRRRQRVRAQLPRLPCPQVLHWCSAAGMNETNSSLVSIQRNARDGRNSGNATNATVATQKWTLLLSLSFVRCVSCVRHVRCALCFGWKPSLMDGIKTLNIKTLNVPSRRLGRLHSRAFGARQPATPTGFLTNLTLNNRMDIYALILLTHRILAITHQHGKCCHKACALWVKKIDSITHILRHFSNDFPLCMIVE